MPAELLHCALRTKTEVDVLQTISLAHWYYATDRGVASKHVGAHVSAVMAGLSGVPLISHCTTVLQPQSKARRGCCPGTYVVHPGN